MCIRDRFNYGPLEILGCDSIFEFKGEAYGKPFNKEEALIRWKKMSGEFGFLHTGHTLIIGNLDSTSNVFRITETIKIVNISVRHHNKIKMNSSKFSTTPQKSYSKYKY